jgi:hypothetical protein
MRLSSFTLISGKVSNKIDPPGVTSANLILPSHVDIPGGDLSDIVGATITISAGSTSRTIEFTNSSGDDSKINVNDISSGNDWRSDVTDAINGTDGGSVNVTAAVGFGDTVNLSRDIVGEKITVSFGGTSTSKTNLVISEVMYTKSSPKEVSLGVAQSTLTGSFSTPGLRTEAPFPGIFTTRVFSDSKSCNFVKLIDKDGITFSGDGFQITGSLSAEGIHSQVSGTMEKVNGDFLIVAPGK